MKLAGLQGFGRFLSPLPPTDRPLDSALAFLLARSLLLCLSVGLLYLPGDTLTSPIPFLFLGTREARTDVRSRRLRFLSSPFSRNQPRLINRGRSRHREGRQAGRERERAFFLPVEPSCGC